jgi:hypothetical protein
MGKTPDTNRVAPRPATPIAQLDEASVTDSVRRKVRGMSHHDGLIAEIERDAIDHVVPVGQALRRCLALGGHSGSEALQGWATRELVGYVDDEIEVPSYRQILAPLMIDGATAGGLIQHQQIPGSAIPDFARARVSEELQLRQGVGELEALLQHEDIRLQPPMASELARLMTAELGDPSQRIISLYWSVSPAVVRGVLDQVRTALTKLAAELRTTMPRDQDVPTAEQADRAVTFILTGERAQVHYNVAEAIGDGATAAAAQASAEGATATATASPAAPELVPLLEELESLLRGLGDGETAAHVAHVATLVESSSHDETKLRKLWSAVKVAATTNEAVALVARITPLLLAGGPHH